MGALIDFDEQLAGTIFQFFRDFHGNHFQRFARQGRYFLIFRNIDDNLHPFQVFGNGQTAMLNSFFSFFARFGGSSLHFIFNLLGRNHGALGNGFLKNGIQHHLVRVDLFGLSPVDAANQLFDLVLKGGYLPLVGFTFKGELFNVRVLG
ncbi:MAG: hypothetical protein BWX99_01250 [Deltaproteobacteria bacterium ADurb.Bin151]|nr:MAG: hypothetical protein BWX99_01250 [Deltaproteobacteria bacterium ADurb.Bin151]